MRNLVIFGAGGYCLDVLTIAVQASGVQINVLGIVDDDPTKRNTILAGSRVYSSVEYVPGADNPENDVGFLIAVGNPRKRLAFRKKIEEAHWPLVFKKLKWYTLIHRDVTIFDYVSIGQGTIIASGARIVAGARLGEFCSVNFNGIVGHGTVMEDYATLGPGGVLCGDVLLGEGVEVGAAGVVLPRCQVRKGCIVGAAALVTHTIDSPNTVWVGTPAKMISVTTPFEKEIA